MLLRWAVSVLSELTPNREILCFEVNLRPARSEFSGFKYVVCTNPNAKRMQCTKVLSS